MTMQELSLKPLLTRSLERYMKMKKIGGVACRQRK